MKRWVTCPADVEKYVRDERERPINYEGHFYPCYIEYEQPWDSHFCGNYYFIYVFFCFCIYIFFYSKIFS